VSPTTYHQQLAREKRAAILDAATNLFAELGYDGASLARIAVRAEVSKATLFKQFPTKAELFAAMVTEFWKPTDGADTPLPADDVRAGLLELGRRYVSVLTRPGMAELFRLVIAEAPRFPELAKVNFDLGKQPFWNSVRTYLKSGAARGTLVVEHPDIAATQFLGMIADNVFWPRLLLVDWAPSKRSMDRVVSEAADTMVARYAQAT
jgi:TetR/AcrR family transcriptional regulator of autoinduction and epiphytic fitness